MSKRINRAGERYGRLVVQRLVGVGKNWVGIWECKCDCGNVVRVQSNNLISGNTKSCGCLNLDAIMARNTKHGLSGGHGNYTKLYRTWLNMRRRCLSKKAADYKYYGGRGITICSAWDDYAAFHSWATGNGYADNLTLERLDNDGDYCPKNCCWADRKTQARNRRTNNIIAYKGESKTLTEWAEE